MSPSSQTVQVAAVRGWDVVTANFIPVSSVASHWRMFQKGAEEAGVAPDGDRWSVARHILVAESDAEAQAYLARPNHALVPYYQYMIDLFKRSEFTSVLKSDEAQADDQLTVAWALEHLVIAGSPRTVADRILSLRDRVGPFGTIVMVAHDWDDPPFHLRSMALMAEQVMPLLNEATA